MRLVVTNDFGGLVVFMRYVVHDDPQGCHRRTYRVVFFETVVLSM